MKAKSIVLGTGVCGMIAGFLLSGNIGKNDFLKIASIATLLGVPVSVIAHSVGESKGNNRANELEDKLSNKDKEYSKAKLELNAAIDKTSKLGTELSNLNQTLKDLTFERDSCIAIAETAKPQLEKMKVELEKSLQAVHGWEQKCIELQVECDDWSANFQSELENLTEREVERRVREIRLAEIKQVCVENDVVTDDAMALVRRMRAWALKVVQSHDAKKEFVHQLTDAYNTNLDKLIGQVDGLNESFDKERDDLLTQIDCKNQRIALLQRQIEGDLTQPEYGQFGYAVEGKIANDIARKLWEDLEIPLAVRGYQLKSDGSTDVGYGYSRSIPVEALVSDFSRHSGDLAKWLGIHKITAIRKHEISDLIVLTFRREPALKESAVKLLAGNPEEFIKYVVNHPIRYRLIADPGQGKTPTTAVMLSAILKEGCRRGNTTRGKKVPHTLVSVSYPGAESSLKDSDYPLERFLKYGTTTAAIKSFDDALTDWEYRQQNIKYAEEFFQIWVWDELDNTLDSADDPAKCSTNLRKIAKQTGHSNVGWIVSGQSVMTSQIKGFKDDDRSLFTEIIIGIPKIRTYITKYGKGRNSDANLTTLERNLTDLEEYIESINNRVTDSARLLRIALVIDEKSPKLYFLPNLDNVYFDEVSISESVNKARSILTGTKTDTVPSQTGTNPSNLCTVGIVTDMSVMSFPPIGGSATCPHCGSSELSLHKDERYYCKDCKKKFASSKVVFK